MDAREWVIILDMGALSMHAHYLLTGLGAIVDVLTSARAQTCQRLSVLCRQ